MRRSRLTLLLFLALLLGAAVPAALWASGRSSSETISVTAGLPHELSLKVSPSKVTAPTAVFMVTNKGKLGHSFKVCTKPVANANANTCTGHGTKVLAPGATATLTVKLATSGKYEYLSGTPSQAKSGMKGLLTVSLPAATSSSGGTGQTTPAPAPVTTTTTSSGSKPSGGGVVNGQATDPACPAGTLVPVGPGTGDQDDDNEGGFPTDGDGCL
jgi:uncharacterized cupredoxin-like copper-binding protein